MWFDINFRALSVKLLPTFLRMPVMVKWVNSLVMPLEPIQLDFKTNRLENITMVTHNSQVCYLRKILNDTYDPDRRITILPPNDKTPWYTYTPGEKKITYLGKTYSYMPQELVSSGIDFIVSIPSELASYQDEITASVNFYRLASKRFKVEVNEKI